MIEPDDGQIEYLREGQSVTPETVVGLSEFLGPERDELTLGEELAFWQSLNHDRLTLADRLQSVGLGELEDRPVAGLSAGQKRRLSVARLQSADKAVWLMDEPLAGLDHQGREFVLNAVSDHLSRGGLAIIASHNPITLSGHPAQRLILDTAA